MKKVEKERKVSTQSTRTEPQTNNKKFNISKSTTYLLVTMMVSLRFQSRYYPVRLPHSKHNHPISPQFLASLQYIKFLDNCWPRMSFCIWIISSLLIQINHVENPQTVLSVIFRSKPCSHPSSSNIQYGEILVDQLTSLAQRLRLGPLELFDLPMLADMTMRSCET